MILNSKFKILIILLFQNWHKEQDGVVDPADFWDQKPKQLILKVDKRGISIME